MSENSILSRYPHYEATIGIEVHIQLTTKSKIFCSCLNEAFNEFSNEANRNICQVCCGYPGVLPVLNQQVVDYAIKAGLATHCEIASFSEFARKHYFYPDLPKNYQITQNDKPICSEGFVAIRLEDGTSKKIRLMRIHIEEDAGKNIHAPFSNESFVDLNRAGTPLLEVVTYPDISNAAEARAYLKTLRSIVMYLDICSGNMEEGAFRADTNISVRKKGDPKLGTRCELKNINSFKFIADAIEYEIERQILLLESGQRVRQETRLWDTKEHKTIMMRSKEEAADYRYFPDPDLPPLHVNQAWIERIKHQLPELPEQKFERLLHQGLSVYEAEILINEPKIAHYYDKIQQFIQSPLIINWLLRDVMGYLKEHKITLAEFKITPEMLAQLISLIEQKVITTRTAQEVFLQAAQTGTSPQHIVKEQNLEQVSDVNALEKLIQEIIATNPQQVTAYKSGKEKLFGFFVGQVMAKTQGKSDPQLVNELLKKYLAY
jgi:aspartyl-tRNA(Asn)/glutamyl-tRNA(Gln) amidotransferase subunit B